MVLYCLYWARALEIPRKYTNKGEKKHKLNSIVIFILFMRHSAKFLSLTYAKQEVRNKTKIAKRQAVNLYLQKKRDWLELKYVYLGSSAIAFI